MDDTSIDLRTPTEREADLRIAGQANCGCVHHAEQGIPCLHDFQLAEQNGAGVYVYTGIRKKDGCFGYFGTPEELPENWTLGHALEISAIMRSLRATKVQALETMNAHWKEES